ncbi:MAG: hypothetical protein PUD80_03060 [Firmicutes bacterium]|nr:hypothetical protein [Bacillota bacterium]
MKAKRIFTVIALIAVFAFVLAGCGGKEEAVVTEVGTVPELATGQSLELTSSALTATTWSSPNGATVNLTAVPNGYAEGQSAAFVVRLEGEDAANVPCDWNGSAYTASADLNAADGYSYFVILTAADGTQSEVPVNTPANPTDDALLNMESALNSYCSMTVTASEQNGSKLTITEGSAEVQAPQITNEGETITCSKAELVLTLNEEEVARAELALEEAEIPGSYTADLAGTGFDIPAMEDDQELAVRLDVTLSNGQFLSAPGGTWMFLDGQMVTTVG